MKPRQVPFVILLQICIDFPYKKFGFKDTRSNTQLARLGFSLMFQLIKRSFGYTMGVWRTDQPVWFLVVGLVGNAACYIASAPAASSQQNSQQHG